MLATLDLDRGEFDYSPRRRLQEARISRRNSGDLQITAEPTPHALHPIFCLSDGWWNHVPNDPDADDDPPDPEPQDDSDPWAHIRPDHDAAGLTTKATLLPMVQGVVTRVTGRRNPTDIDIMARYGSFW